jgi:dTDP-4-dehydrorhamnose reductase
MAAVRSIRPDAIINAAAYTAVDACEANVEMAYAANAHAVGFLATAAAETGAHLVHVSTDYVFDGELDRPYHEWDVPSPRSVYGASKLAGEREAGEHAAIVRTSWVCGEHGSNMLRTVVRLAAERDHLEFVDDQRGCPTFTADLATVLRRIAVDRRVGVHHVTNQGAVSWYEFVREIVAAAGHDPGMVRPISTADLVPRRPAPRPVNSVLDNAVLRLGGDSLLRDFREPLAEVVARLR